MRFEVKTDQQRFSDSLTPLALISMFSFFVIVMTSFSMRLSKISRYYEINYLCKLILVQKSSTNFKRLSKLTNQTNKQKIWDLCKEF